MGLAENIKQKALQLGFDLVGITDASSLDRDQSKFLTEWLDFGYAGRMDYMRNSLEKRTNPVKFLKSARSIICLGLNYTPPKTQKKATISECTMGTVANFAQYEDYHLFIKKQLRKLTNFITSIASIGFKFKICVDSAPLAERILAARAGLGFIGKNHMLINPKLGPQIFLAEIVTSLKLPPDEPIKDVCQACNRCLTACPTGALMHNGHLDANKCISYLTIELKDDFPVDLAPKIGAHFFGCDECVLACPHYTGAPVRKNKQFKFYNDRASINLNEILNMNKADFETKFADAPFSRLGLVRLKRNAQICLNNISSKTLPVPL